MLVPVPASPAATSLFAVGVPVHVNDQYVEGQAKTLEASNQVAQVFVAIDYTVGVVLNKLVGETVKKGDVIATLYVGKKEVDFDIERIFTIK